MTTHHNKYRGLGSGLILREAGVGGSNPLTPTNETRRPRALLFYLGKFQIR